MRFPEEYVFSIMDPLVTFSCKTRGFRPSCHAKRLEEWGEWMRETFLLDMPHCQVVFTISKMVRRGAGGDGLSGVHRPGDLAHSRQGPAVYPKRRTSQPQPLNRIFPYLLDYLEIIRPNHAWTSDITYILLAHGFAFLAAVTDWFSRHVLAWELSIFLKKKLCLTALDRALGLSRPEIFNSDQGGQFTSPDFTGRLEAKGMQISMEGRGRVFDNIFIERLHSSLAYRTPREVYFAGSAMTSLGR